MRRKNFLLAIFCITVYCLPAQDSAIHKKIEAIEKSNSNAEGIKELNTILATASLNAGEKLAAQTALVHKYQELQQWDICLNYCQQQIILAHQQKNTLAEATFYKHLGSTYYYIPQKKSAIEYWKKSIAISEPNNYQALLAQCYHNVGVITFEEADYSTAEKYFIKAIDLSKQNNDTSSATFSLHYRLLATTYDSENKLDKAEEIFQNIIAKCRAEKDSANLVEGLLFYTNVLKKKKEFEKAIVLSYEALTIARKINLIDGVITALNTHAANLADAQNFKEAYKYKYEEDTLLKTRFNGDLNKKISDAEAAFKNAEVEHEKEVAVLEAKKEKQIYFASIIILLLAAGLILFYVNQKRKYRKRIAQLKMQRQVQEEKERLSRDLHDNLGSQLALLSNSVEHLETANKKQKEIAGEIDKVKNTSRQLLQTLRETIWILNKEEVSAEDFFDKLVEYTTRYLQLYPSIHLSIDENFEETKTLNSNHALQLFRICQEAINNSCKYSGSEILILKGILSGGEMQIQIEDRGIGFNISSVSTNDHYGIENMKQRAASIAASLKINTEPGKGTLVSVSIKI
jgi:signal transduction histidine kinase